MDELSIGLITIYALTVPTDPRLEQNPYYNPYWHPTNRAHNEYHGNHESTYFTTAALSVNPQRTVAPNYTPISPFLSSTRHCRRQHRSLTQNPAKAQHYFLSSFESVKPSHPIVILLQKHALNSSYAYHDNVNAEIIFQHSYSTTVSLGIPNTAYRNYRVMSILPSINTSLSHTREQDTNKNCLAPNPY